MFSVPEVAVEEKQAEVSQRGLMSYPVDSQSDSERQEVMANWLASLPGPAHLDSPVSPIRMYVDANTCPRMAYYFSVGDYEQGDMELLTEHLRHGDTVVEFGGGVGLTASMAYSVTQKPIVIYEPNQALHSVVRENTKLNRAEIHLEPFAVVSSDYEPASVSMALSSAYWWSSISNPPSDAKQVDVPCKRFSEVVSNHKPNVVIFDIEGYESPLFEAVTRGQLGGIETMFIEIHAPTIGVEATAKLFNRIYELGFTMVGFASLSFVFKRKPVTQLRGEGRWY